MVSTEYNERRAIIWEVEYSPQLINRHGLLKQFKNQ
jgi:hypothetical protein